MGIEQTYDMKNVFYRVGMKADEALRRLRLCEVGDLRALEGLSGDRRAIQAYQQTPANLYSHEWGVGRDKNKVYGDCILIKGDHSDVNWTEFLKNDVIPIAHSHPFRRPQAHMNRQAERKHLQSYGNPNSLEQPFRWDWLIRENDAAGGVRRKVLPSASDFVFCARHSLAIHRVETAYVVREVNDPQAGKFYEICNLDDNGITALLPRLNFNIYDSMCHAYKEKGPPEYRARLEACAGMTPFWRGNVIAFDTGMFFSFRF